MEMPDFRNTLKEARLTKNISQTDFAESLGISQKHLNLIENCQAFPSFPLLYEIIQKLGLEINIATKTSYNPQECKDNVAKKYNTESGKQFKSWFLMEKYLKIIDRPDITVVRLNEAFELYASQHRESGKPEPVEQEELEREFLEIEKAAFNYAELKYGRAKSGATSVVDYASTRVSDAAEIAFKAGALSWKERSDRELGEWRELAECRQFTIVNQQSEIAELKAEIDRLKKLNNC